MKRGLSTFSDAADWSSPFDHQTWRRKRAQGDDIEFFDQWVFDRNLISASLKPKHN